LSQRVTLRDGSSVDVRPITPDDRDALTEMYAGVSDESRYRRFLSVHPELLTAELTYLTQIDHHDHEALIAFEAGGGPAVGVVRYIRTEDDEAEPAMLITDSWQGRGLVTVMLELLVARAWDEGIRHFRAPVGAENTRSLHALDALGAPVHHGVGSEIDVEVALRPPSGHRQLVRTARPPSAGAGRTRTGGERVPVTIKAVLGDLVTRRPPPDQHQRTNTIVVGVSDGDGSAIVLEAAAELAQTLGAALVLVRARRAQTQEEAEESLETLARSARARGIAVSIIVRRATPAAAIVAACVDTGASMVVIGPSRRRRAGAQGGLVGAVADLVLRQAPCNVLLLNPAADVA